MTVSVGSARTAGGDCNVGGGERVAGVIEPKTGVSSRHELTALVRKESQEFGRLALGA